MVGSDLPLNLVEFIDEKIDSIEQLQILLLLHAQPARTWSVSELTAELRSSRASVEKRLGDLYDRNILLRDATGEDRHRFVPAHDEISELIRELAAQHQLRPHRLIEIIYAPRDRSLRAFASAFVIRRKN